MYEAHRGCHGAHNRRPHRQVHDGEDSGSHPAEHQQYMRGVVHHVAPRNAILVEVQDRESSVFDVVRRLQGIVVGMA